MVNPGLHRNTPEHTGIHGKPWFTPEYPGTFQNTVERLKHPPIYTGMPLNMNIYAGIPVNMNIYAGIPVNMNIYAGIPVNMNIYAGIPLNMNIYAGIPINMNIWILLI